ncbi:MAG: phospholipase D-like domain-containing protein [Anaerolineae bacterium]
MRSCVRKGLLGLIVAGLWIVPGAQPGQSSPPPPVVLNEIAWMGTTASPYHEWMELQNTTDVPVLLDGWTLAASDGTPTVALSGTIPPYGYFLLERTDDHTVPDVAADLIYTGALANSGEFLTLSDGQGNPVDQVDAWHAGDNATKQTMQRFALDVPGTEPTNWVHGPVNGTPQNSAGALRPLGPLKSSLLFTENITATMPSTQATAMERALLDLIGSAQVSIEAALYALDRERVRDALMDAHGRGVRVRVVADDDAYNEGRYHPHFAALEAAGIPLVLDNRASLMHNKFLVVDGQAVWTGSTNMTNTDFTYNHNNSLLLQSTYLAYAYGVEFHEMFALGRFGRAKGDNTPHLFQFPGVEVRAYFAPTDGAGEQVLAEVARADRSIYFAIFFFTSDGLADALLTAFGEGVTVRGIWDRLGASNRYSEDERLCQGGIPVKVEDFGGKLHHKFMVVDVDGDDPTVITGSMNWGAAGAEENDENTLIIHDAAAAQRYYEEWQRLWDALGPNTICRSSGVPTLFLPLVHRAFPGG